MLTNFRFCPWNQNVSLVANSFFLGSFADSGNLGTC